MRKLFMVVIFAAVTYFVAVGTSHLIRQFHAVRPADNLPPAQNSRHITKDTTVKKEQSQPTAGNSLPSRDQAGPPENPAQSGSSKESPVINDQPPEKQDRTVYSWWFKRNSLHNPPQFDPAGVKMVQGKGIFLGNTSRKRVYLTFDEGYENGYTPEILDILKADDVHAAFFVTADFVNKNPGLVKRMVSEGHIVGNHTATHPCLPELTDSGIRHEIEVTHNKVRTLTGVNMIFMRPPKGEYNSRVINELNEQGYTPVFWSIAYKDWDVNNQPGKEAVLNNLVDNLHPGAVILLHAVSQSNTEALDEMIKDTRAQGYSFGTLDELK